MRVLSKTLLLVVQMHVLAVSATTAAEKMTRRSASEGKQHLRERSTSWWDTALDFFTARDDGNADDLAPPSTVKQEPVSIAVPGVDMEGDEMVALRKEASEPIRRRASLLNAGAHIHKAAWKTEAQAQLEAAQARGLMIGARLESDGDDSMWHRPWSRSRNPVTISGPPRPVHKPVYVEEYDELPDEVEAKVGQSRSKNIIHGVETLTSEDRKRLQAGDVDHIRPTVHPKRKHRHLLHRQRLNPLAMLRKHSQQTSASSTSQAGNMQAKCEAYASFLKGQNCVGPSLVAAWSRTCQPAVHSGTASPKYSTMCSALMGAVEPFATDQSWTPAAICKEVVRVFSESGLGATPFNGF